MTHQVTQRQVYVIALGANLHSDTGSPASTLQAAVCALSAAGMQLHAVSRFYVTPCFPAGAGPDYINACASVSCDLDIHAMIETLHAIETSFGRERKQRWGARVLDLDLIAADDTIHPNVETLDHWIALPPETQRTTTPDTLILPHPRMQDRAFVLVPMADIAARWRHPRLNLAVSELCAALPQSTREEPVPV